MTSSKNILIIGGYGAVGLHITDYLVQNELYSITLAGRSIATAKKTVAEKYAGKKVSPLLLDVQEPAESLKEKIKNFDAVIMCIDQTELTVVQVCADLGVPYLDITATDDFHKKVETHFAGMALQAPILLSIGLAPGLSNLLAKKLLLDSPQAEQIDISILLGSGEKHGLAAIVWTLKELIRSSRSGGQVAQAHYGPPIGTRTAFPFKFSDQYALKRSFPKLNFTTRLSMESRFMNALIQGLYHWPLIGRLLEKTNLQILAQGVSHLAAGTDIYSVKAFAAIPGETARFLQITGHGEGHMTGYVAALTLDKLLRLDGTPRGVFHIHDLFSFEDFYLELQRQKCEVTGNFL